MGSVEYCWIFWLFVALAYVIGPMRDLGNGGDLTGLVFRQLVTQRATSDAIREHSWRARDTPRRLGMNTIRGYPGALRLTTISPGVWPDRSHMMLP